MKSRKFGAAALAVLLSATAAGTARADGYTLTSTILSGLETPQGLVVDDAGNIFLAEHSANFIIEFVATNNYQPVNLDNNNSGTDFGPTQLAFDGQGNLFVADSQSTHCKEFLAPNYPFPPTTVGAALNAPFGVAVDAGGNLFISDSGGVKKIPAGNYNGPAQILATGFSVPGPVIVDGNGNLFVTDFAAKQVYELLASESYGTKHSIGSGFTGPGYMVLDQAGNLYVSDQDPANSNNDAVKELLAYDGYNSVVTLFHVKRPVGLALGNGNVLGHPTLLVANSTTNTVGEYVYEVPVPSLGTPGLLLFALAMAATGYGLNRRRRRL